MFKKTGFFFLFAFLICDSALGGQKVQWPTSDGIVPPKMTTTQMNALANLITGQVIYNTTASQLYQYNGTSWVAVGSAGSGAINYIANPDAETATTTGWTTYADAAGAKPVACSGGSPTVTWTTTTSNPLRGNDSFLYTRDAANRQGQGAAYAFTIAAADEAKPLTISFEYGVASGTWQAGGSQAGGQDSDVEPYIYDVTNSAVIQPAGYKLVGGASGQFKYSGVFQSASNSTSYRLCLHTATTVASALTVAFDTVSVGPQVNIIGAPVTDWTTFTPTGAFTTNTTYTGFWRRVGDSVEVQAKMAFAGAPNSVSQTVNLPSGLTIDTTKLTNSTAVFDALGTGSGSFGGNSYKLFVAYQSTTAVDLRYQSAITGQASQVTQAGPATIANTDFITIWFRVPIVGWGTTVTLSSDNDPRVVAARMTGATATVTGSYSDVTWTTVVNDTHGGMGAINYTVPMSGFYNISGQIYASATTIAAGQNFAVSLFNTTTSTQLLETNYVYEGTNNTSTGIAFNYRDVLLNAGTQFKIQVKSSDTSPIITASAVENFLAIERTSGPASVAVSETVTAAYHGSSTTINGSLATITYSTKDFDDHAGYSGGTYTIGTSGKYQVNAGFATTRSSSTSTVTIQLNKNGAAVASNLVTNLSATAGTTSVGVAHMVSCNAGDTITILGSDSGTSPVISNSIFSFFSIARVGN